jgi:hypothetical protein
LSFFSYREKRISMKFAILRGAVATAALGFVVALAAAPASVVDDPANGKATVTPIQYQSPFRDYRPLGEDQNTAWKDANDTVRNVGGWRAYAREAAEANKAREAADAIKARESSDAAGTKQSVPPRPIPPAVQIHKHGG